MSISQVPLAGERGKRQHWLYTAKYHGGGSTEHELPCGDIRFNLSRFSLHKKVCHLGRQHFKKDFFAKKIPIIKHNVFSLLRSRGEHAAHVDWETFFNELPQSENDPRFVDNPRNNKPFSYLVELLAGSRDIQGKHYELMRYVPRATDYIDPITTKGGK